EIQKGFVNVKREDRGVRQAGFLVLRKTSMPSVLVELGFITNKEEERYMKSTTGQKQLTESIYNAFCRYKREIDRKKGVLNSGMSVSTTVEAFESTNNTKASTSETSPQKQQQVASGAIIYKVQILTSDKKLSNNDKRLKGYKNTDYYIENGTYKYTYGESTDFNAIKKVRQSLLKDFKDAFIVSFQDGKKVTK
ncbi:N-acetylmuramoyl-L-alanine amidase, partial [Parabacteroides sp. OttesenSCG-928-N08]|nr:N-acetylmuramoyl-L-alanine amidase [Parabacteroides sp. OttesenSCG-928-N08]